MKRDPEHTIRVLLAGASRRGGHREARAAWVKATAAAWREAQRQMDEPCAAAVTRLREAAFERLCDVAVANVDAFRAPLTAVAERDAWPREMHWGGI
jgi:hypothetical protein